MPSRRLAQLRAELRELRAAFTEAWNDPNFDADRVAYLSAEIRRVLAYIKRAGGKE